MKYCLTYQRFKDKEFEEVNELKILFNPKDKTLPQFLEKYVNKTIIINLEKIEEREIEDYLNFFSALRKKYHNFKLCSSYFDLKRYINRFKEFDIPFFFLNFANTWDIFNCFLELGVSDIYIAEMLGFDIETASYLAHKKNCQIRIYPNIAQSSLNAGEVLNKSLVDFYVRPEDTPFYEKYVDVYEIFSPVDKELFFYKVYAKDKKWWGPLNELILGLKDNIDNRYVGPEFAQFRVSCGKKCFKGESCKICYLVRDLSYTLAEREQKMRELKNKN